MRNLGVHMRMLLWEMVWWSVICVMVYKGVIGEDTGHVMSEKRVVESDESVKDGGLLYSIPSFNPNVGPSVDDPTIGGVSAAVCGSPVKDLEEAVVCHWVLEFGHEYLDEELFCFMGRSLRREDLWSLAPGLEVYVVVVNAWSFILNCRELRKDFVALSRLFSSTYTTLNTIVQASQSREQRYAWFRQRLTKDFEISPYREWKNIEMFVFPIIDKSHFYMLCVDLRSIRLEIIDNSSVMQTNLLFEFFRGSEEFVV